MEDKVKPGSPQPVPPAVVPGDFVFAQVLVSGGGGRQREYLAKVNKILISDLFLLYAFFNSLFNPLETIILEGMPKLRYATCRSIHVKTKEWTDNHHTLACIDFFMEMILCFIQSSFA